MILCSSLSKRDLPYPTTNYQQRLTNSNPVDNWNPKVWDWDTIRFLAKLLDSAASPTINVADYAKMEEFPATPFNLKKKTPEIIDATLRLNLGGGFTCGDDPGSRPNKRVRSGSPGSTTTYPMCQVDNYKDDLSVAKDYHRRHKVCELHNKSTKALVANQMQRFCQQFSRFHPLSEFDEGKRSCRRRLAGHNRRRRKTQPDDVSSRLVLPGDRDNKINGHLDIFNMLAALACAQEKSDGKTMSCSLLLDKEQLLQILSKINSLPLGRIQLPRNIQSFARSYGHLSKPQQPFFCLGILSLLGKVDLYFVDDLPLLSSPLIIFGVSNHLWCLRSHCSALPYRLLLHS